MADSAFAFDEVGAQRIVNAVRAVEGQVARVPPGVGGQQPRAPIMHFVRIVSTVLVAGRYDAFLSTYSDATSTWSDGVAVWVKVPNAETLAASRYKARLVGFENGRQLYVTDAVAAAPASGVTVREQDGSPSYASTTTLTFDQADGFVLTTPAANEARIDIAGCSLTQAGIVNLTTNQVMGDGNKVFSDSICAGDPTLTPVGVISAFHGGFYASGGGLSCYADPATSDVTIYTKAQMSCSEAIYTQWMSHYDGVNTNHLRAIFDQDNYRFYLEGYTNSVAVRVTAKYAVKNNLGAMCDGQSTTISYRKSDGVSNGTLTFTGGILTSFT